MAYIALYRKYRPKGFEGLIGQDHIVNTLKNQIMTDKIGHAYLFTGTRGTGKTSLAKIFAKAINCLSPKDGSPCGECECCVALSDPSNIDVIEIDAASNNGVGEIRDLREKVQYPPVSCKYKVYIIDEVHMLSGAAFNALLKTLEEPPKHAIFILATTEVHKIPQTILSRCMRFDFKLIKTEIIADLISNIYDECKKEYEKEAVMAIAKAGEGSIRDALSIADIALSFDSGKLTYEQVNEILGSGNLDCIADFAKNVLIGNTGEVLNLVDSLASTGKSMSVLSRDVNDMLRNVLIVKTCNDANKILSLPKADYDRLESLSELANENRILRSMEIFSAVETDLKFSTHPRIVFETAAVKASRPDTDYNIDALMSRIKQLEDMISSGNFTCSKQPSIRQESENVNNKIKTLSFSEMSNEVIKGKLLTNLRKNGSEMLWNFMQEIAVENKNDKLLLITQTSDDKELLEKNISKINTALEEFGNIEIEVVVSAKEKIMDEFDASTEKIKKLFGDNIVIIKD